MTTIQIRIPADWSPLPYAEVKATPVTGSSRPAHNADGELLGPVSARLDTAGEADLVLPTTVGMDPEGTHYRVTCQGHEWHITVPASGTFDIGDESIATVPFAPAVLVPGPAGPAPDTVAIEALPAATTPDGTELVPVSQVGTTVRLSLDDLIAALSVPTDEFGAVEIEVGTDTVRIGPIDSLFTIPGIEIRQTDTPANKVDIYRPPGTAQLRFAATGGYSFGTPSGSAVTSIGGPIGLVGEQSPDPAAPGADQAKLFLRDNGAGKTQVCVRFATGATQVIATEP